MSDKKTKQVVLQLTEEQMRDVVLPHIIKEERENLISTLKEGARKKVITEQGVSKVQVKKFVVPQQYDTFVVSGFDDVKLGEPVADDKRFKDKNVNLIFKLTTVLPPNLTPDEQSSILRTLTPKFTPNSATKSEKAILAVKNRFDFEIIQNVEIIHAHTIKVDIK